MSDAYLDDEIDEQRTRIQKAVQGAREIKLKPRSKWEISQLQKSMARHKDNLVQKQVVWGKEFKGNAYVAKPAEVMFLDFVVGEKYVQKFTLTNVSYTFNAFRIQDLDVSVRDFFTITFTPQSYMSAGMACEITVAFHPKKNEDIDTVIPFLAQTGPLSVPLKCRTRKCVVSVSPTKINFQGVVLAETVKQTITVTNEGALSTRFTISGSILDEGDVKVELEKLHNILLPPYGSTNFVVSFTPSKCQPLSTYIIIQFQDSEVPQQTLLLDAEVNDVPVFVSERSVLDFNCCYVNVLYRNSVTVCNRGKIAMRAALEIPTSLKSSLEVVPQFGYVQPNSGLLVFQLKFKPTQELLESQPSIETQMRITVQGQTLPVYCTLKALLTLGDIVFNPSSLNFGTCTISEKRLMPLEISNTALLPQRIGFITLPASVSVSQDVVEVLPGEKRTIQVGFTPLQAKDYSVELTAMSHRNIEFPISISGSGANPKLSFSESRLKLASVAIGESVSEIIILTNNSNTNQVYEFNFSKYYGVRISPVCGELPPRGSETLLVEFCPTDKIIDPLTALAQHAQELNDESVKLKAPTPPVGKPAGKKGKDDTADEDHRQKVAKAALEKKQQEIEMVTKELKTLVPWSKSDAGSYHRNLLLPCFIRGTSSECLFLEVVCTVTSPTLICDCETIDFGDICVLQKQERSVTLKNVGKNNTVLSIIPLDPHGPYTILRPPSSLKPGETCEVMLRFQPKSESRYVQTLCVSSTTTNKIDIPLSGRGLMPNVVINPQGAISMGACFAKDSVSRTITFTNKSTFALTFSISFLPDSVAPFNHNGTIPFLCVPSKGTITKGASTTITVYFQPDHECEWFRAEAEAQFGGSAHTARLVFEGNGFEKGLYAILPTTRIPALTATEDIFSSLYTPDALLQSHARDQKYLLEFNPQCTSHIITVGNNKHSSAANGEISVEGLTDSDMKLGWKIDSTKVALTPGSQQKITLSFNATELVTTMVPVSVPAVTVTCNVRLVFRGGNPVPSNDTYYLTLRGTAPSQGL